MEERGRQRSTKKNPSRDAKKDQFLAKILLDQTLVLGQIDKTQAKIDQMLDNYSSSADDTLKSLAESLSTLKSSLTEITEKMD